MLHAVYFTTQLFLNNLKYLLLYNVSHYFYRRGIDLGNYYSTRIFSYDLKAHTSIYRYTTRHKTKKWRNYKRIKIHFKQFEINFTSLIMLKLFLQQV